MRKKAEAWKEYQDAAMVDMVLETLPKVKFLLIEKRIWPFQPLFHKLSLTLKIAAEIAAPLTEAKKITMVSTGGGDIGAAKLTGEVFYFQKIYSYTCLCPVGQFAEKRANLRPVGQFFSSSYVQ